MNISIIALNRGGWSAYGDAYFDARSNTVFFRTTDDDESRSLTVTMPATVSSVTETEDGITGTTPALSTSTFTATLSSLTPGGRITYDITTAAGVRRLVLCAERVGASAVSDYGRYW